VQAAIWVYPWDVLDVGIEAAVQELIHDTGLDTLSLAVSYHAGHFLQPRNPQRRIYFPDDGTIYFQPDWRRYDGLRLQPEAARLVGDGGDALALLAEAKERHGFRLSAWTVCLHNTRLGWAHPDVCAETALGDRHLYNPCPSHPDVRSYMRALVADITHRPGIDDIEIESPGFMGFFHRYHHEKDGVGLLPEDDFLFSLCFCKHCRAGAEAAGVDAATAQAAVARWLLEALERPVPEQRWPGFPAAGPEAFAAEPAVVAYIRWRSQPVTTFVAELREVAHPDVQMLVHSHPVATAWVGGLDPAALAHAVDGIVVNAYKTGPLQVEADVAAMAAAMPPATRLSTGLQVFWSDVQSPDGLARQVAEAIRSGSGGVHFYNWGLFPPSRLAWVRAAVAGAREV
jgi:hypothetical protein